VERQRRRRAEAEAQHDRNQLAHAARLSTVGELSASIAHEINQPLGAILLNAEEGESLLASGTADPAELREILEAIRKDDERASEVIQRLRRLLRREPTEMRPIDLNEAVDGILRLIAGAARRNGVNITTNLDPAIPKAHGDQVQIQQVLLNLIMNAMDAFSDMPQERRRLTIATSEHPSGTLEVRVSDAGPGIAPERMAKLFDPFFSTKRNGMGLGLSISRSLVHAHGGRIWVESTPDGATFRFSIPAAGAGAGRRAPTVPALGTAGPGNR
jgi:C4-dicarboxylate-specific signal transduction histidine kinase